MHNDKRKRHYEKSNGGKPLTPRQLKRLRLRDNKEEGRAESRTAEASDV